MYAEDPVPIFFMVLEGFVFNIEDSPVIISYIFKQTPKYLAK